MLKRQAQGFSLLELIIVLVIIGVLVAAITLSISDNRGDTLNLEARRLAARISLARDEAILTNQEYGLEITHQGYRFLVLNEDRWQTVDGFGERQLIQQDLPEGMEIQLNVEGLYAQFEGEQTVGRLFKDYDEADTDEASFSDTGTDTGTDTSNDTDSDETDLLTNEQETEAKKRRPQIYLMTSGEINPFTIVIGYDDSYSNDSAIFFQLSASIEGEITLNGPIRDALNSAFTPANLADPGAQRE